MLAVVLNLALIPCLAVPATLAEPSEEGLYRASSWLLLIVSSEPVRAGDVAVDDVG